MIRSGRGNSMSTSVLARVVGVIALLVAPLFWFAPALAATPAAPGEVVTHAGSRDDAQRTRFNDFQRALGLTVQAQDAADQGAYHQAEVLYQQAFAVFERALGPEDLRLVGPLANLADVYRVRGEFDRAELLYRRLAFLMEQAFGPSDIRVGTALASTAEVVAGQGHYGQAKSIYERALAIHQATLGADDPRTVRVLNEYAGLLMKLNRQAETGTLTARVAPVS
jgi:tetratricopeptide (TPR) repeat protein